MTGSLQVKKGKYYAVINLYDAEGKRIPKWIATGLEVKGNKKRAEAILRDLLKEYEQQQGLVRSDILFSDYIRLWLKGETGRVDTITLQGYEILANSHILPYFDELGIRLQDVTRMVLQTYINQKRDHGRKDGKGGLSPASLKLHKNILRQTLTKAVKNNLLPANPCDLVTLPKQQVYESTFYTTAQMAQLLDAIQDEPLYPLVKLTAFYGLRRSELLGLKWDSINFDANTITVRHTVVKVTDVVKKDKTKNQTSHRAFPLVPEIKELLLSVKSAEEQNREAFGGEYKDNDYVFKWEDGRPYSPDYVSHKFNQLLKQYGLPHIRFHELRHSCASILLEQGFSLRDIQEWLGHADIRMTSRYSHLDMSRKKGIADSMSKSFLERC